MRDAGYTIRTMAQRCGMTAHTLRYYERVGLIQPVGRAHNGHRRYSDEDEAWLNFLHCMRATNMPIREMQRYAALRERGEDSSLERRRILEEHRTVISEQIAALEASFRSWRTRRRARGRGRTHIWHCRNRHVTLRLEIIR